MSSADRATLQLLLRYRDQHPFLPVIVISANSTGCCTASGFHLLAMPFTQSTLDQSINTALAQPVCAHAN